MRRREFIGFLGGAVVLPVAARAQQTSGRPVIGVLSPTSAAAAARSIAALRAGLADLGYSEGGNISLELRFADGEIERLPALATELVKLKPVLIVAGSPPAALAAHNATRSIPIVINSSADPVALGLADSLARPGGNVTGFWWGDEGLLGKQLELLKQAVPGVVRVGIFVHPNDIRSDAMKSLPEVSRALGLAASVIEVQSATDFDAAFATAKRDNLQAAQIGNTPFFVSHRAELAELAARMRTPVIYGVREFAVAGGFMSYGTNLAEVWRNKARLVDRILKGTRPADLPIERPTKFEFVVNLKAAKALGIELSPALLARADEVIE